MDAAKENTNSRTDGTKKNRLIVPAMYLLKLRRQIVVSRSPRDPAKGDMRASEGDGVKALPTYRL
jgi:hypothetical protein